jgi:hypothetical protein
MKRLFFTGLTAFSLLCTAATIPAAALTPRFNAAHRQTLDKVIVVPKWVGGNKQ